MTEDTRVSGMKSDQEGKEDSVNGVPYSLDIYRSYTDYEQVVESQSNG
jgi:hypothetical protein